MSPKKGLDKYRPRPEWIRYLLSYIALFLGKILFKITITGQKNIPKKGPYIIAGNHFTVFDPPLVILAIKKPISFLAASDMKVNWYENLGLWLYGFIPTNRAQLAPSTIKKARKVLKQNKILGIFPEGNTESSTLRKAKPGVVYLSTMEKVKILPIGIYGLKQNPINYILRRIRPKISIKIGKTFGPLKLPVDKSERDKALEHIGKEVMLNIAALLPDECHGEYSGDNLIYNIRKNIKSQ